MRIRSSRNGSSAAGRPGWLESADERDAADPKPSAGSTRSGCRTTLVRPLSRSCATLSSVYSPGCQREGPPEDQVAALDLIELVERALERVVIAEPLDDLPGRYP